MIFKKDQQFIELIDDPETIQDLINDRRLHSKLTWIFDAFIVAVLFTNVTPDKFDPLPYFLLLISIIWKLSNKYEIQLLHVVKHMGKQKHTEIG